MKLKLPPNLKYKTSNIDKTIKIANSGKEKKYSKIFYLDDKLYLEIPFVIDMRYAIEQNLKFEFNIMDNSSPLSLRGVDVRPANIDNKILEKMNFLEGQDKENSKERKALLLFHKEDEIKASLTTSRSATRLQNSAARNTNPALSLHTSNTTEAEKDVFDAGNKTEKNKIAKFFSSAGPSGDASNISLRDKVSRVKTAIREKDASHFAKIKYNSNLVIKKTIVDYSLNVPNSVVENISILNDRSAFGLRTKYYLGHPANPGKRSSRSNKNRVFDKTKRGSELIPGAAEKVYEQAEIDAFSEKKKEQFHEAEKIISADQATESPTKQGSDENKNKQSSNPFLKNTTISNDLSENQKKEPKILESNDVNESSSEKSNNITFMTGIKSNEQINNKNSSLRSALGSKKDNSIKNQEDKTLLKRKPRKISAKYEKKSDMNNASQKLKRVMGNKTDPARYLKLQKATHTSLEGMKKPTLSNRNNFEGSRYVKKSTNLLGSDPINTLSSRNVQTEDERLADEIVSSILTEVPYELTYSEDNEDYDLIDQTEFDPNLQNFPIVFSENVSNRRRYVKHTIEIDNDHVIDNKIYVKIIVKSKGGVIVNSKKYCFNMMSLRKQFLYPSSENTPVLSVSQPDKDSKASICIDNNHNTEIIVKLYEKKFKTGLNPQDSKFNLRSTLAILPGDKYKENIQYSRNLTTLYRMCYQTKILGDIRDFDNIILPTTVSNLRNKNENNVTLYAYQQSVNGITLVAKNLPLNVSSLLIKKRRLNYNSGNSSQKNAVYKALTYTSGEEVGFLNIINHKNGIVILDKDVRDGDNYQYIVELYSASGTKISNSSLTESQFIRSKNLVNAILNFKGAYPSSGTYIFKLILEEEKSDIENIIQKFDSKQFELFKDKIDNLTKLIQQPATADVFLINQKSGKQIKLGNYTNKSTLTFSCNKNSDYTILVKPISINPESLLDELNRLSKFNDELQIDKNDVNSKRKAALDSLRGRESRELIPFDKSKFTSFTATNKGVITDPATRATNFSFNLELDNYTGDNIVKNIFNIKKYKFGAKPLTSDVRPSKHAHISFRVLGETKRVDFYFVSTIKEGVQNPLTTLVADDNKSVVSFIDYSNEDYYGRTDYYVQAVFQNGAISNLNYIGSCIFLEKGFL